MGNSWLEILEDPLTRKLLGHDATMAEKVPFVSGVTSRLKFLLQDPEKHLPFAKIGYTALEAFLQANCTGPPLEFDSVPVILPKLYHDEVPKLKEEMLKSLSVDGIDVYPLTPRIELFWLAKCMMDNATLAEEGFNGRRARFRVNFWHQKLLSEPSDTLRDLIYRDTDVLDSQMLSRLAYAGAAAEEHMVEYLVERANVKIYYGDNVHAREDLLRAAKLRNFEFALTGALGKRTKFQEKETSQLVVLAKSRDQEPEPYHSRKSSHAEPRSRNSSIAGSSSRTLSLRPLTPGSPNLDMGQMFSSVNDVLSKDHATQPENVPLKDDTLLENIQFNSGPPRSTDAATEIVTEQSHLPLALAYMDPADQPQLFPMDSIILLVIASSISNTQASDGLTREETLPYASRVLEGGSSNWSVYSQALLVRSRIESFKSRTTERGLLQLQALVDQVIAETTGAGTTARTDGEADTSKADGPTTFLPQPTEEQGASVAERLQYVHQIHPAFRWELEAELAARWTQMGGLKTALDIYERLQMHAEVALCLAATDQEAEAVSLLKKLLFVDPNQDMQDGDTVSLNQPLPSETPRLLCILGEIQDEPKYYNLAWTVSNSRYARAQRSLGKFYLKRRDMEGAMRAFVSALKITRQDLATWFSLGCVQLELEDWQGAVESFTRVVQLEDKDAQGWSNLAVALLKLPPPVQSPATQEHQHEATSLETIEESAATDEEHTNEAEVDPLQHTREALRALRRAAQLKRDDARIWDNYLTVAASIPPDPDHPDRSTPWQEVLHAMSQVITLRHKKEGESCIDLKILEALVDHVTGGWNYPTSDDDTISRDAGSPSESSSDQQQSAPTNEQDTNEPQSAAPVAPRIPFLVRALTTLTDGQIAPLATSNSQLFLLLSRIALWRHRPAESLALIEKAWRATTNAPTPDPKALVEATGVLVNGYRTLGPMERERTGGAVEKGWKFKSRSAIRSVMGKAKGVWDETEEYERLQGLMEELKNETDRAND